MQRSEYVVGRMCDGGEPVGEAHAVIAEAARGTGGFRAECGKEMDVIRGGSWPPGKSAEAGPCPVCSRLTGA